MTRNATPEISALMPNGYETWRKELETIIENSKFKAISEVNTELLTLYWTIGNDILQKQKSLGWGTQVIRKLSSDLSKRFPDDRGYSVRNLNNMRQFAKAYPNFPFVQVPLAQISWYHHISLLSKVKDDTTKAFYIIETALNGWSRDVMMMKIANSYITAKGKAITNFESVLPPAQSKLAKYAFKDPYKFSFIGTVALQNELDIEKSLAAKITEFLLEMGQGFAFVGRQFHVTVDNDDYYIDILMYHLKLHCYVVVELKAVEFIPEFVSKLNFYISAIDDTLKSPSDQPTIGLLLCRTKSDKKARFALRGITQPMGIAQYETDKLFADVASSLPQIEDLECDMDNL